MTPPVQSEEYRRLGPPLGPDADGERVDRYLARAFPFKSRDEWKRLSRGGELLINGRPGRPSQRLRTGDRLAVFHPLVAEPEVDIDVTFLAESAGLLAVAKPGNLPMHEAGLYRRRTFGAVLAARFGPAWAPVHRLDRETSGIVLCAATPALRAQLTAAFFERRVAKRYVAILCGAPAWNRLAVDRPIALQPIEGPPRYTVAESGAAARTDFTVRARARQATLVDVDPRTGRTNQIRVHAAATGHPLVGDKIYHTDPAVYRAFHRQGDTPAVRELAGFARHALHAQALAVCHPTTGREFAVEAPLPQDLAGLWRQHAEIL